MSSFRIISRNVFTNWLAYAITMVVTFFLTPFVLHELGDARYGVWAIVISVTGYYGLLDLGLRAGMTQYITRYFSQGDFDSMNRAASSGFAMHACSALFILVITIVTAVTFPSFLTRDSVSPDLKTEATWCILILGTSTAFRLLLFPLSVALTAKQRFDVVSGVSLLCRILTAVATVWSLWQGFGLVGVCASGAVGNLIDYCLRAMIAKRILPELRISLRLANWASARECLGFGFWSALLSVSHLVINLSDAMVIGFFMPVSAIAFFTLANSLIRYFANAFAPVSQVFFPAATDLDARDDFQGLQKLYLTGSRMLSLMAVSAALILSFLAADFYLLWVGVQYVEPTVYTSVPILFQILLVGSLLTAVQGIGSKILLGRRQVRGLTWLLATEATLNLLISIALIRPFGLLGVAIGTAIPAVLCRGLIQPIMVCKNLKLQLSDYGSQILLPTVAVAALLTPLLIVLHRMTGLHRATGLHQATEGQGWVVLVAEGAIASVLALLVVSVVGLKSSDRQLYLYPSIRRVASFRPFFLTSKQ